MAASDQPDDLLFAVRIPQLDITVRVTREPWQKIIGNKHPDMLGREEEVRAALTNPDQIRRSRKDGRIYLCYKLQRPERWLCAVIKTIAGDAFLVTAYRCDAVKEGESIWPK